MNISANIPGNFGKLRPNITDKNARISRATKYGANIGNRSTHGNALATAVCFARHPEMRLSKLRARTSGNNPGFCALRT